MAVTVQWYSRGLGHFLAGSIDWDADTINMGLLDNTYVPDLDLHEFWDSGGTGVGTDEVVGTGYTAGGVALGTKANTQFASSALTAWAATTAYALGDMVRAVADDGFGKIAVVAGTSSASEPTWVTTALRETVDTSVVWGNLGPAVTALDFANPSWAASTITAAYGVVYKTGAAGTTDFIIGLVDFGGDESSSSGTFEIQLPSSTPAGLLFLGSGAAV